MSKYNIDCDIVKDVLPLYAEHMTSESTSHMVEKHLKECEECNEYLRELKDDVPIPVDTDASLLKNMKNKMYRKKTFTMGITICITILFTVLAVIHMNTMVEVPYEDLEDVVVTEQKDGSVQVEAKGKISAVRSNSEYDSELGKDIGLVSFEASRWRILFGRKSTVSSTFNAVDGKKPVECIFYSPSTEGKDALIYGANKIEHKNGTESFGEVTMERLVWEYYVAIAVVLTIIGIILSVIFRKSKKKYFIWKIVLLPILYLLSYVLINTGMSKHYEFDMVDILLVTVILYFICYWILGYFIHRREMK